ncbi:hypothetical protein [Paraburkholderia sp.]|uniref:hypothetical protein n=1 Tax=Paraburkholderia sp. TaxID=1926495 RepID=UPI0025FF2E5D|nr:hypothetical protein [Paraburkholderia sp.]
MKTWLKAYRRYLEKSAKAIPVCLFTWEGWRDLLDEAHALLGSLLCVVFCLFITITFPVSVFVVAAWACEADRRLTKRHDARMRAASRNECINWSDDE